MLKKYCLTLSCAVLFGFFACSAQAAQKSAVLLAAFGSVETQAVQSIEKFAASLRVEQPERKIVTAFLSPQILEELKDIATSVPSFASAVSTVVDEGYTQIGVLALQVVPGQIYADLVRQAASLEAVFGGRVKITVSPPLAGSEQDVFSLASSLIYSLPGEIKPGEAVFFAGYGGEGQGNLVYPALNWGLFLQGEKGSLYLAVNVDNKESIAQAMNIIKLNKRKVVWLAPLHTVYGKRAAELFSTADNSLASQLKDAGFTVRAYKQGLIDNAAVQNLWKGRFKRLLADMAALAGE